MRKLRLSEAISFGLAAGLLIIWTIGSLRLMPADAITTLRAVSSFWCSGWAANHGLNPYGVYPLVPPTFIPGLIPHDAITSARDINLNPPALLPLFQMFALFDPHAVVTPWVVSATAIFLLVGFALLRDAPRQVPWWQVFCMLLMTPVRDTIWLAQVYALVFLCAALGWMALKRNMIWAAGLAIGTLAAIKPNFALWPVFLFVAGELRVATVALAVVAALCVLPVLLDGPAIYPQWLRVVQADQHWMFTSDISLSGLFHRAGALWLGRALSVLLVLATAYVVRRRRLDVLSTSVVALCVSILAAPLAWGYYAIVLIPSLIDGLWGRFAGMLAALLMMVPVRVPLHYMLGTRLQQFGGTLIVLVPVCIVLWHALWARPREDKNVLL
jgi:hypothetical protein